MRHPSKEKLEKLAEKTLNPVSKALLLRHISICQDCRTIFEEIESERRLIDKLKNLADEVDPDFGDSKDNVFKKLISRMSDKKEMSGLSSS